MYDSEDLEIEQEGTAPALVLRILEQEPVRLAPSMIDVAALAAAREQIDAAAERPIIEIHQLHLWADAPRAMVLRFLSEVWGSCAILIEGNQFPDLFEGVLAALVGPTNLTAHKQTIKASIEAAALVHNDFPGPAADRIRARIKEVGGGNIDARTLTKMIRDVAGNGGQDRTGDRPDSRDLAERYIQALRTRAGSEEEDGPLLLYFRSEFYERGNGIWIAIEDDRLRAEVTRFIQEVVPCGVSASFVRDVIGHLQGIAIYGNWQIDPPFFISSFQPAQAERRDWVTCHNGNVDVEEAVQNPQTALHPIDPLFFNTTLLPFAYDPAATCPMWERFLDQVLPPTGPQDHRQQVVQEFFGYALLADNRFHKMLILHGPPHTGKSTILLVLQALLSASNVSNIPFDQLTQEFSLCELVGKSANFSVELDHIGHSREGLLNQLVSGEPVTVNRKRKPRITIRPRVKLAIGCNDLPAISDTSGGVWRRLIIVPCNVTITQDQTIRRYADQLSAELPGILNWALRGLARLLDQNRFTACRVCQSAVDEHRTISDSVAEFLTECCVRDPRYDAHGQRLYELYEYFTKKRGRLVVAEPEFGKRVKRRGIGRRRARPTEDPCRPWLYRGLRPSSTGAAWVTECMKQNKTAWKSVTYEIIDPVDDAQAGQEPAHAVPGANLHRDGATRAEDTG